MWYVPDRITRQMFLSCKAARSDIIYLSTFNYFQDTENAVTLSLKPKKQTPLSIPKFVSERFQCSVDVHKTWLHEGEVRL